MDERAESPKKEQKGGTIRSGKFDFGKAQDLSTKNGGGNDLLPGHTKK